MTKFRLHRLFLLLKLTEVTLKWESVKRFSCRQIPTLTSLPSTLTTKKVHEDEIFDRQDKLQFFSGESKDYKYLKSP